jgi:hypothetical protein
MPRPRTWAQYTSDLEAWRIIRLKTQEATHHMKLRNKIIKGLHANAKNKILEDEKNLSYQPTDEQMMADLEAYMKN